MLNVLLDLCFVGTNYHGFQVQDNAVTVSSTLQDAMQKLFGTRPDIKGCSRTDAGVHAKQFCVSFFMPKDIPLFKLPLALNAFLPQDIRVTKARRVKDDFHARYSVLGKQYVYKIINNNIDNPFEYNRCYRIPQPLDIKKMQTAAKLICGSHDFKCFMSAGSDIKEDTVRTVYNFDVTQKDDIILFCVYANGYLYNMVRIMVGTLVLVGSGKIPPQQINYIINSQNRRLAGPTLPPQGLYLDKVLYPDNVFLD